MTSSTRTGSLTDSDLDRIRAQFPALAVTDDGAPRVYFDNPAGTQVPNQVLDRMRDAMVHFNANMHGNFRTTRLATELEEEAHRAMADFYHAPSADDVVFGANMTTLTFMMTRVLAPRFEPGDEMIITSMEHEGNNTPWRTMAAERGMVVKTLPFNRDTYEFDLDELDSLITQRTRFAALNFASNLLGTVNPIKEMVAKLQAVGALTYVDAVQFAPHGSIDVQDLGCDFLVSSPYKYYGPHQGVLYGRSELLSSLKAYKLRVVADQSPGKFETGTQSLEGQAGVLGAIEYLQWYGTTFGQAHLSEADRFSRRAAEIRAAMQTMVEYEKVLAERLVTGLLTVPDLCVRGITDLSRFDHRVPTVSFTHPKVVPADLATFLDTHGVYAWDGHSYALPVVEHLGIADSGGVLRLGPTHYNTLAEVDTVVGLIADYVAAH
jgi:cysteine desulfurase family protein (TIGR01976 family)